MELRWISRRRDAKHSVHARSNASRASRFARICTAYQGCARDDRNICYLVSSFMHCLRVDVYIMDSFIHAAPASVTSRFRTRIFIR
eukprot:1853509-Pleurochrysis_carterae.AAC.1